MKFKKKKNKNYLIYKINYNIDVAVNFKLQLIFVFPLF